MKAHSFAIVILALGCNAPQPSSQTAAPKPTLRLTISGPDELSTSSSDPWTYNLDFQNSTTATVYITFYAGSSGLEFRAPKSDWQPGCLAMYDKIPPFIRKDCLRIDPGAHASHAFDLHPVGFKPARYELRGEVDVYTPTEWAKIPTEYQFIRPDGYFRPNNSAKSTKIYSPTIQIVVR